MTASTPLDTELTAERLLTVPFRRRTYLNLVYLALAFPLGVLYFVGLWVGLSTGVGLAITLFGIPVILLTIVGAVLVAGVEARLTTELVGVDVPPPESLQDGTFQGALESVEAFVETLKEFLSAPTTWTSLAVLVVKFVFGIVAFTMLVTLGALVLALVSAPFVYALTGVTYLLGAYTVESLPAAIGAAGLGLVVAFLSAYAVNLLAIVGAALNAALLDFGSATECKRACN